MTDNVVALPEPRQAPLASGGKIAAIIPQSMEDAYRLAKAVCMAGMAPKGMDTPEKAMICIMRGLEVGMTPFQALDKIAVVNGRPVIWGDGALGLVRGSGLCEYVKETTSGVGDARVATCTTKRKGEPEPIQRSFSVADAKKAGLWGKAGPWTQFADRMLQMRARAFCLRDGFADVLGGLYLKEELDNDGDASQRAMPTPPAPPPAPAARQLAAPAKAAPAPSKATAAALGEALDFEAFAETFRSELQSTGHTLDESSAVYAKLVEREARLSEDQRDELDAILREHTAPFWQDDRQ